MAMPQRRHLIGASSERRSGYTTAGEPHALQENSIAGSKRSNIYDPAQMW
jgi:hypothetical protein